MSLADQAARDRIRDAAQRAISLVGEARPFVPVKPMEMILEVTRADYADGADRQADVERIGARTTRRVTSCALDLFF